MHISSDILLKIKQTPKLFQVEFDSLEGGKYGKYTWPSTQDKILPSL